MPWPWGFCLFLRFVLRGSEAEFRSRRFPSRLRSSLGLLAGGPVAWGLVRCHPHLRAILLVMGPCTSRAALLAATAVAAIGYAGAGQSAPFTGSHLVDGVVTSGDDYGIWVVSRPVRYRLAYPARRSLVGGVHEPDPSWRFPHLESRCRADAGRAGFARPAPLRSFLWLPYHPDAPTAYQALHPLYWLLGLLGLDEVGYPVSVTVGAVAPFDAKLVVPRLGHVSQRPDLWLVMPPEVMLDALADGLPLTVVVRGSGFDLDLRFGVQSQLAAPARSMLTHCSLAR